jgi:hypothetical protein
LSPATRRTRSRSSRLFPSRRSVTRLPSRVSIYAISITIRNSRGDAVLLPGFLKGISRPNNPVLPSNPSGLEAASLSSTTVGLRWTASSTTGAGYLVSYRKVGASDTASSETPGSGITISGNSATVTGLAAGAFTFYVFARTDSAMSTGVSIDWASATRYTQVAANTFDIGPAYAFIGYRNSNRFDSSTYISNAGYSVATLDDLYLRRSLDTYISGGGANAGNILAFNLPATSTDGKGVAFLMRVGNNGVGTGTHYARVLVRADATGRLLRGTAPNRYAEVEISYQPVAGVPYAKGVVRNESVPAYMSTVWD